MLEYGKFFGNAEMTTILLRTSLESHRVDDYKSFLVCVEKESINFESLTRIASNR